MSKLLWVSAIISTLLGIVGVGVLILKEGWLFGLPCVVLLSINFTFSYFALSKYANKCDFISGEFDE